ncbi:MAG: ATP-binding protein [Bacteroidota bacterium]|nr:ATP-binding protein [Bacteroidota bacterium]MDE2833486.1 ATP-binding protein [Bacteroidota bacterium]MDE2958111.1 ATP-binding protein [Bacteroidota bacterium]
MISGNLNVSLMARLSELRDLAAMVETFGEAHDLPHRTNFIINLALEELITNTLLHGQFEDGVEPEISISLGVNESQVVVVLESNGGQFDPTQDSNPDLTSDLADRPIGGLGLHLVKSQADRFEYEWADGINRITLTYNTS